MSYTSGSHTVFHHRYHIVWITKYRYKVLEGELRERIRTIIRQVCKELGVQIVSGVLSREHVHMFVEIPPHLAVSDFVRRVKGQSSHRVQMEFPDLRKRYWGRHFWARGYFSTTSGNITDDVILQYLQEHEPTGVSGSYSVEALDLSFASSNWLMRILRAIVGAQSCAMLHETQAAAHGLAAASMRRQLSSRRRWRFLAPAELINRLSPSMVFSP